MAEGKKQKLGEMLLSQKVISRKQLRRALEEWENDTTGKRLGMILVELGYVSEDTLISFLAKQCGIPHLKLSDYEIDSEVIKYLPPELVSESLAVPIDKLGKILTVAMVDPMDQEAVERIREATGFVVKPIVCTQSDMEEAVERYYGKATLEASKRKKAEREGVAVEEGAPGEAPAGEGLEEALRPLKAYTFDDFVVGEASRFTYATAKAVAEAPARDYNPLFIYSGVGLGKTHLVNAIGNYILQTKPEFKVVYLSSERFTSELVDAIQNNKVKEFRKRYRDVDVLLLDDIHFLAGKERAQEEFFHTFNELYNARKQIVVTSDRPPKSMMTLEKRLRSRFEGGIITDIQPPEMETRVAILKKKLEKSELDINDDVLTLLASRVRTNVRELEGTLRAVIARAEQEGVESGLKFAQKVLVELLGPEAEELDQEEIRLTMQEAEAALELAVSAGAGELWPEKTDQLKSEFSAAEAAVASGRGREVLSALTELAQAAEELAEDAEKELLAREEAAVTSGTPKKAQPEEEVEAGEAVEEEPVEEEVAEEEPVEEEEVAEEEPAEEEEAAGEEPVEEEEVAEEEPVEEEEAAEEKPAEEEEVAEEEPVEEEAPELVEAVTSAAGAVGGAEAKVVPQEGTGKEAAEAVAAAQQQFERAVGDGAREFAPEPLGEVEELLINAEAMLEAEEFEEALAYALRSQEKAAETLEQTGEKKRELHRKEAEENLRSAEATINEAVTNEAEQFAAELLGEAKTELSAAREVFEGDQVAQAHRLSKELLKKCEVLVRETGRRRKESRRKELEKVLHEVSDIVEDARAHGAERYAPKALSEVSAQLGSHQRMLEEGEYEEALKGSKSLLKEAEKVAKKAREEVDKERALREEASKVLAKAEKLLQEALAAGALRYALEVFQRTQVTLAEAQEVLPTEDVQAVQERAKDVLEQAKAVLGQIETKKRQERERELEGRIAELESGLNEAKEAGAEKYASVLLGEAADAVGKLRKSLKAGRLDEVTSALDQANALVEETLKSAEDGLRKEQRRREEIEALLQETEHIIAQAQEVGSEQYAPKSAKQVHEALARVKRDGAKLAADEAKELAIRVRKDAQALLEETRGLRQQEKGEELRTVIERVEAALAGAKEAGSEEYLAEQTAELEERLREAQRMAKAERFEDGIEVASPLVARAEALVQHTVQRKQEDLELRAKAEELLGRVDERLAAALESGAEEYASEGLKNINALAARARDVFDKGEVRRAHDLAHTVEEKATELVEETRLRRTEYYRERFAELMDEARRRIEGLVEEGAEQYAAEALEEARGLMENAEALMKSRRYEEGVSGEPALLEAFRKAAEETKKCRQEEEALRSEVEEGLAQVTSTVTQAVELGAAQYAAEPLEALRELITEIENNLAQGDIRNAQSRTKGLTKRARDLLEETKRNKEQVFRDKAEAALAEAKKQAAEAEDIGASRYVPEILERCLALIAEVEALIGDGALEEAVAKGEEMKTTVGLMLDEAREKQREEEEFRGRVEAALRKAEEEVAAALGSDIPDALRKEARKADVFLSHARRAHDGGQYDRSLKYSGLAMRKAAEVSATAKAEGAPAVKAAAAKKVAEKPFAGYPPLNEYTLENFLVGEVNRFTYSTVKAVAENPGEVYNPLFIHGAAGLGKTHLLNGAGNYVIDHDPDAAVVYMSSEQFANELVEAIENETVEDLRTRFSLVDVLLLDDVQFLAGRQRAQEEFARTFAALHAAHKQVIITSDKPPSDLVTLQSRLRNRFEQGVITDLQMPEAAIRRSILQRLASGGEREVPDDVIELLGASIQSSVRELQGSLKKLLAYATTSEAAVSMDMAREVLKDVLPPEEALVSAEGEAQLSEEERLLLEEEQMLLEEEKLLRMEQERMKGKEEQD